MIRTPNPMKRSTKLVSYWRNHSGGCECSLEWYIWPLTSGYRTPINWRWIDENSVAFYFYWIEQSAFSTWLRESPSLLVFLGWSDYRGQVAGTARSAVSRRCVRVRGPLGRGEQPASARMHGLRVTHGDRHVVGRHEGPVVGETPQHVRPGLAECRLDDPLPVGGHRRNCPSRRPW